MKFTVSVILTVLLAFAACLYLPWWSIALAAFLVAVLVPQRPGKAFLSGFLALLLLWCGLSFWISNGNEHLLAHRISLLILKVDNPYFLILVTGGLGALVAGFAALAGAYARRSR
jgi:hypothetical protein